MNERHCMNMRKWILCITAIVFLFGAGSGCRKALDEREKISVRKCDGLIQSPDTSPETKALAKIVRRGVIKGTRTGPPVLLQAGLLEFEGTKAKHGMFLDIWAPSGYVNGFTVIEKTTDANGIVGFRKEDYSLLQTGLGQTGVYLLSTAVSIRDAEQHKDEQAWKEYLQRNDTAEPWPDVWVSMPIPGKCEVEIVVHDKEGQVSNPMPLVPDHVRNKGQVIRGTPEPRKDDI